MPTRSWAPQKDPARRPDHPEEASASDDGHIGRPGDRLGAPNRACLSHAGGREQTWYLRSDVTFPVAAIVTVAQNRTLP